jgi:hypothetical protein
MYQNFIQLLTSPVIKAFLIQTSLVAVVHHFVTTRINYCIFLLYGISDYNSNLIQRIQNGAALVATIVSQYFKMYVDYL